MIINLITIIHVVASILLIAIVLVQGSKSEGLSGFLGSGSTTFFGTSTSTVLVKITTVIGVIFMITSITLTVMVSRRSGTVVDRSIMPYEAPADR